MFRDWCVERGSNLCSASVSEVCAFLQSLLHKGLAYRTLGVFRSSISKFHNGLDGKPIGQHAMICRFFKGGFS